MSWLPAQTDPADPWSARSGTERAEHPAVTFPHCPLCNESSAIPLVASYAACDRCGLVRRRQNRGLTVPGMDARAVFERASSALRRGGLRTGMRVLVLGGSGDLVDQLKAIARVEATDSPVGHFERVFVYDLEGWADPVGALFAAGQHVAPGGQIVAEVSDLARPIGVIGQDVLDGDRRFVFSEHTLRAVAHRAGIDVERFDSSKILRLVGQPTGERRVFDPAIVGDEVGAVVAERVDTYRYVERIRQAIMEGQHPGHHLPSLHTHLGRRAFPSPTKLAVRALLAFFTRAGYSHAAVALSQAILDGPHTDNLREACIHASSFHRAKLGFESTRPAAAA